MRSSFENAAKEWSIDPKKRLYKLPAMYVGSMQSKMLKLH